MADSPRWNQTDWDGSTSEEQVDFSGDDDRVPLQPLGSNAENINSAKERSMTADLVRLRLKHRTLKRAFIMLSVCSFCMLIIVLIFSYRSYQNYYLPSDSSELEPAVVGSGPYASIAARVLADMDRTADPCEDFYQYACGGWLARTTLDADQMRYDRSFDTIKEQNQAVLLGLLRDGNLPYLSELYTVCMDEQLAENTTALQYLLNEVIGRAMNLTELYNASATLRLDYGIDIGLFFTLSTSIDERDPSTYSAVLWQGSPILPDASYYEDTALLSTYRDWMSEVYSVVSLAPPSAALFQDIIDLEIALLGVSNSPAENRDPVGTYNPTPASRLPAMLHEAYTYIARTLPASAASVTIGQPRYFARLEPILASFEYGTLKRYALLRLASTLLPLFGSAQRTAALSYQEMIFGVITAQPREEYCLSVANGLAGMRLSYYFVQSNFDEQRQVAAVDMIERIEAAYLSSVSQLHWMDNTTRAAAAAKLNAITNMVGHPVVWPDWEAPPAGSTLFEYYTNAAVLADAENRAGIGQAVDRLQWYMIPTQVNAYYEPSLNQIVFPAGILQAPFFDSEQPIAVNYGGLGSVIGHELGHSLDDSGSEYTASGALGDWWSDSSRTTFEAAAQCISDLYSGYEVQTGLYIDGDLVLGESIADLGGLRQSYAALEQWRIESSIHASTEELAVMDAYNMSSSRLFFISFAQAWCEKSTSLYQQMLTETNPHPVSRFRVRGALSNSAEFASTFSCPSGSTYNPPQRCTVW